MNRFDKFALLIALLSVLFSIWVALGVNEGLAQLEDEYAYLWQARLIAQGEIKLPSPPESEVFRVPFVIDYQGERFGKYPLGWPVILSFGEWIGLPWLVNPLLGGLAVWLTYRLGKKLLGERVGLLAAGLTACSPFFLTYSGSLLSHTSGLVLSLGFALSWLDLTRDQNPVPGWLPILTAGATLGVLASSRPLTALGVAIPFMIQGIFKVWRGSWVIKKRIILAGLLALILASLHYLWRYALTGNWLLNPYTLWWDYDKLGFGKGFGPMPEGNTLAQSLMNTRLSLRSMVNDLFGWGPLTWLLPLAGIWINRRQRQVWLISSIFFSLTAVYLAYWVSGSRYFYEGLYSLTILSASAIAWITGWHSQASTRISTKQKVIAFLFGMMVIASGIFYTPARLKNIEERYGFSKDDLRVFQSDAIQEFTPALILVYAQSWKEYGAFLHLEDPDLTTPLIFAWIFPGQNPPEQLSTDYPDRTIYYFYPDDPGSLYIAPR